MGRGKAVHLTSEGLKAGGPGELTAHKMKLCYTEGQLQFLRNQPEKEDNAACVIRKGRGHSYL